MRTNRATVLFGPNGVILGYSPGQCEEGFRSSACTIVSTFLSVRQFAHRFTLALTRTVWRGAYIQGYSGGSIVARVMMLEGWLRLSCPGPCGLRVRDASHLHSYSYDMWAAGEGCLPLALILVGLL